MLPLQKATYHGRAVAVSFGESAKGNTQIAVTCDIVDDDGLAGEQITWIGHFTDKTAARTIESLMHMGWQGDDPTDLNDLDGDACTAALPTTVELVCEPEEYNGEWTLKVQWVNKIGAGRFAFKEPLSGSKLKAFGAQMRSTVKSVRAAGGAPRKPSNGSTPKQAPHPNAPDVPDDIPFLTASMDAEPDTLAHWRLWR